MALANTDAESSAPDPPPAAPGAAGRSPTWVDGWRSGPRSVALIVVGYLGLALVAMKHLLAESATQIFQGNARAQAFSESMLVHGAHVITQGQAPFHTDRINFPDGVNPLATHGFLGLSIPLTPLTLVLGPALTFAIAVTLCLVATAYAWYHVLYRHFGRSRLAAILAGALGGLGPAMVSHAQGDLSRVAMFLVPFLIWWTLRLREPGRALRNGLILGLLAAWQFLIDEEVLYLCVLGWVAFLIAYGLQHRAELRRQATPFLRGLAVAAITGAVLVGYPLWVQLFGPQSHRGASAVAGPGADVFSYFAFAAPSLATWPVGQLHYAATSTDQNAFFGWPLVLLLIGSLFVLRTAIVRAMAGAGIALAVLSLGTELMVKGRHTHVPGPWRIFALVPALRPVPPADLALAVVPFVVLLFAMIVERGGKLVAELHLSRPEVPVRIAWYGLLAATLVPLVPAPIKAITARVPAFVADGTWRNYVPAGHSIAAVPSGVASSAALRWTASTGLDLPFAGIDFGVPVSKAASGGKVQDVTDRQRAAVRADLRYGRVSAVVLMPQRNEEAVRQTASSLLGFYPLWVDGVWLWDLRTVA